HVELGGMKVAKTLDKPPVDKNPDKPLVDKNPDKPRPTLKKPPAPTGDSIKGDSQEVDDLMVAVIDLDAKQQLGCMRWVDEQVTAFYALDKNGVLRRVSFPDFKVSQTKDFERKCAWLDISAEGLLLSVPDKQEVWLVDPEQFEVKATIAVPNLKR